MLGKLHTLRVAQDARHQLDSLTSLVTFSKDLFFVVGDVGHGLEVHAH